MQIDLAQALQAAGEEGVGGQQFTWRAALDVPLTEGGIGLFDEGRLLGGDLDGLARDLLLQRQPALVSGAEALNRFALERSGSSGW
jgi:hypothetical protein